MDKKYNHLIVEKNKDKAYQKAKTFSQHDLSKEPFTVILPPPNVTGQLHLGHAWNGFLQDSIIRYKKLQGFDVLWLPAMDHAGIATQAKVEARLREKNISRYDLGREKFLEKVWSWKDEYAQTIKGQWSKLGLALDYSKERFTLDQDSNNAVNESFIKMYQDGLIYRGKRAINWDPKQKTALSNIEVLHEEKESEMVYIKYFLENSKDFIEVATTRVETLPSDVAVVVAPHDKRFKKYIGKNVIQPFSKELIPVMTDSYVDPEFGTGAMKVSAHAIEDIRIIQENNLEIKESINDDGSMNELAKEFKGQTREEARKNIAILLEKEGLITKVEKYVNKVSISERSGAVVEILVKDQWFVKMDKLATQLLKNINSKKGVNFYPERFKETIKTWMNNVYDWCISRQLWWGHQIPAWYKGTEVKVQLDSPGKDWIQDEDVLDTWFSSALTPFSFLGWPDQTEDLKRYYPTSLLVTGYDIVFFWVSRMYFQGLNIMKEIPFKDVLIHGLIRDEQGRKMSKSLGNGIDPMEVVEQYGSDSLRWFLLTNSTPGQDIRFNPKKLESAWNLNNKIWNISRYVLETMENSRIKENFIDKWIKSKLATLESNVAKYMETYDFTIVGKEIYDFIQNDFSGWYIEMSKASPNQKVAKEILAKTLVIIYPLLPMLSEEIWSKFNDGFIANQLWGSKFNNTSTKEVDNIIEIVKAIREFKVKYNLNNKEEIYFQPSETISNIHLNVIKQLCNGVLKSNKGALFSLSNLSINILISKEMNQQEENRINEEIKKLTSEIKRSESILNNQNFINKASPEKVKIEKEKYAKYLADIKKLKGDK